MVKPNTIEVEDGIGPDKMYNYDFFLNNYRLGYFLIAAIVIGIIASSVEPTAIVMAIGCALAFGISPLWVELTFLGIIEPIPVRYLLVRKKNRRLIITSFFAVLTALIIRWAVMRIIGG